ncbi:MAG: SDR family NAD(P)-dependent oxidoreductase [Planctomycetota bacterium]|nr:SDR family NAD(P)-dependent oxidoreductase [Planctomycetota bacterium]
MSHVLDQFRLDGKTALVTGGTKGLGLAMATALAEAGAEIALCSRNLQEARVAADAITQATGRRAVGFLADVTSSTSVQELAEACQQSLGPIDILINNAGCNIRKPLAEISDADWDLVIDTSVKGSFYCSRAFLPGMIQRKFGRVINLGSIMSFVSLPGRASYATAKSALLGLTRTLALEAAPAGVTVNLICPGPFETPMNRVLMDDPAAYQAFMSRIPLGRWGQPTELGGAVVFLCSAAGGFMTGSQLVIDGGWTAQ